MHGFALTVKSPSEKKAIIFIVFSIACLLAGLILSSLLSAFRNYSRPSLSKFITILLNYTYIFPYLASFLFLFAAQLQFRKILKMRFIFLDYILSLLLGLFLGYIYLLLIFQNPNREVPVGILTPASFYIGDFWIISTILLPMVLGWTVALFSIFRFIRISRNASVFIYKSYFNKIVLSITLIVLSSIILHFLISLGTVRLLSFPLLSILAIAYIFIIIQMLGFLFLGSVKKSKSIILTYSRTLLESSIDPIASLSIAGIIDDVNEAMALALQRERDILIGAPIFSFLDQPEIFKETFRQIIEGKSSISNNMLQFMDKSGNIRHFLANAVPYKNKKGEINAVFLSAKDITEQRNFEIQLQNLNQELLKKTGELENSNKELEAFSYSVSHDLRAPLRAIDGFSVVLLQKYSQELDKEAVRFLNIIRSNTQDMGKLIDNLLSFSKVGKMNIQMSQINMDALAKTVFEEINSLTKGRSIEFNIKSAPPCIGDTGMIKIVLTNLISNAIKFTGHRDKAVIDFEGKAFGNEIVYSIRDNGVGFDMKYYDKLFGIFQRLHSQSEFEGTGIGLALIKRIITRHGGKVWAESTLDTGSIFYFTLTAGRGG